MAGELAGVDAKIRRAHAHLADLDERIGTAVDPGRYRFTTELEPKTNRYVYRVHDVPVVDPEWAIVAGEAFFQLRSALDHLAYRLVEREHATPTTQTQFPIRDTLLDKNGRRMPLKSALMPEIKDRNVLSLLHESQPYHRDGGEESLADARKHPLWHLKVFNNIDKHRLLLVVVCVFNVENMYWGLPQGVEPAELRVNLAPLVDGTPVAWFDFHGAEPPEDFDPHPSLKIVTQEAEAPLLGHVPLHAVLESLISAVEWDIVSRFRPFFE